MGTEKQYEYKGWDAYAALISAVVFLLKNPKYGIALYVVIGLFGGRFATNEVERYTGIHVEVGHKIQATDVSPNAYWDSKVAPEILAVNWRQTWASPDAITVKWKGHVKFFGFADTGYRLWKSKGKNEIIVFSEATGNAVPFPVSEQMFQTQVFK